jgi:hypothetical protein
MQYLVSIFTVIHVFNMHGYLQPPLQDNFVEEMFDQSLQPLNQLDKSKPANDDDPMNSNLTVICYMPITAFEKFHRLHTYIV